MPLDVWSKWIGLWLCYSTIILAVSVVLILVLILYLKITTGKCQSKVSLSGKTAIITGANTGIGYYTAQDFAKRGAKVILACRDKTKGEKAVEKIIKKTDNTNVFLKHLDLSSFKSVRQFAKEINDTEKRLDILVNNAAVLSIPPQTTEDRLMLLMQTNYFGPVLLTMLLLDLMKQTSNSRIVNVSSLTAKYAVRLDVNHLNDFPQGGIIKDWNVYSRSKLCNILFTIKLAEKLKGTSVTTYSLHPGVIITEIYRHQSLTYGIMRIQTMISRCFMKSVSEGAQTTIYCSVAEGIENLSGQHFHDCHVVKRYKTACDPELSDKLWQTTKNILNLNM